MRAAKRPTAPAARDKRLGSSASASSMPAAAAVAGGAMVAGNALAAMTALGGGIQPARLVFLRLLLGVLGKWVVVLAVFTVALGAWRLPPLPMLVGLAAGVLAYLLALNWCKAPRAEG